MFELKLKDLSESKRQEMLNIFTKRKDLLKRMGGCPAEDERVKGHECFHCDECWITAIVNSFKKDQEVKNIKENIFPRLEKILIEQLGDYDIQPSKDIIKDFGADSLDVVELIMAIENEFDIHIPDEIIDGKEVILVSDLIDWIKDKI